MPPTLTMADIEILQVIHLRDKEIAERLKISTRAVEARISTLRYKFQTNTRVELALVALHYDLIEFEPTTITASLIDRLLKD